MVQYEDSVPVMLLPRDDISGVMTVLSLSDLKTISTSAKPWQTLGLAHEIHQAEFFPPASAPSGFFRQGAESFAVSIRTLSGRASKCGCSAFGYPV